MTKIGVCGTGKMGSEIIKRLLECGQEVSVWNRTQSKANLLIDHGASVSTSISDLIRDSEVILIIMGSDAALDFVYKNENGLKNNHLSSKIIIELSTTSVQKIISLEKIINDLNGKFIECPVGGSTKPARDGNLLGLVGGNEKIFHEVEYILKMICRRYEYLGEVGKGASMKLAINLPLMVYWQSLGEAMSIAINSGINFDQALDIMMDSSGSAKVAHLKAKPIMQAMKEETNLTSTFNVSSSLKDMKLMIDEGTKNNIDLRVINSAMSYVQEAVDNGWSDFDASLLSVYISKQNFIK
ncbi:NAD(P)-dependent oxidoreductase [Alphaproteobacteria bacterium]|jgi:3-hydroxyisobutyrate dehydrogenase|nr:NAD(P)-dependent oxidoreductase [Alphaproteobacteria bacterium]